MPELPPDLPSLLGLVWTLCMLVWRRPPLRIGLDWDGRMGDGEPITWLSVPGPVVLPATPPAPATPPGPAKPEEPFVPTPFQEGILEALEGVALRTTALGAAVGDKSRLFRHPGGIKELQEQGLVTHHNRLGYYRPDAPPEQLRE